MFGKSLAVYDVFVCVAVYDGFVRRILKKCMHVQDSSQMESNDLVISTIDIHKSETKIKDSLKVDSRRRKSGEADFDIHLGTSKHRKSKVVLTFELGCIDLACVVNHRLK